MGKQIENKLRFILIIFLNLILFTQVFSQTLTVSGRVFSGRVPIKNASITFIDKGDTNKQYNTYSDALGNYSIDNITSVDDEFNTLPDNFELGQNYPNPFSSMTAIPYNLKGQADINITIYDILGREVRKFTVSNQTAGIHSTVWDGKNMLGKNVASGAYFYKLESNGESLVKKMMLNQNGNVAIKIPIAGSRNFKSSLQKKTNTFSTTGTDFIVRVENSSSTKPLLNSQIIEDVTIQNDTSISFSVDYIPLSSIYGDSLKQVIQGFGAATPWYRPVAELSEIQSAFGRDEGEIGLNILRLTLDPNTNNWSKWIPSAKKAYEMGAKIIAAPWYAPSNMIERVGNRNKIKQDMYDDYVDHLNSYIKFMADNGAPLYGISIQNEPDISEDWTWWEPEDMLRFMRDFAQDIEGALVMSPESFQFRKNMSDPILNDSAATANTDIIIGHIYGGGLAEYPLAAEKGKEVWMTEYLMGDNNSGNNIYWAMEMGKNINAVMQANMNAYVWWTMIRFYGPIGDGTEASNPADPRETFPDKGEVTKKGYVLSQFSKFVNPGDYRVESSVYPIVSKVSVTAYKDPSTSKLVVVAVNTSETETLHSFRFENDLMNNTLSTVTTSSSKNSEQGDDVEVVDGVFKYNFEPQSITTFIIN